MMTFGMGLSQESCWTTDAWEQAQVDHNFHIHVLKKRLQNASDSGIEVWILQYLGRKSQNCWAGKRFLGLYFLGHKIVHNFFRPCSAWCAWSKIDFWEPEILTFFQALALLCMMCAAPAYHSTQHWFLLVVVCGFLGSGFFSLYHLCLDTYLKNLNVGWLPAVSLKNWPVILRISQVDSVFDLFWISRTFWKIQ